jgi:hypothetical protein
VAGTGNRLAGPPGQAGFQVGRGGLGQPVDPLHAERAEEAAVLADVPAGRGPHRGPVGQPAEDLARHRAVEFDAGALGADDYLGGAGRPPGTARRRNCGILLRQYLVAASAGTILRTRIRPSK